MIFQVEHGCFAYNKEMILRDVSFEINSGEIMAVLGSTGVQNHSAQMYDGVDFLEFGENKTGWPRFERLFGLGNLEKASLCATSA